MEELPGLDGSKHTIFGRLLAGKKVLHQIEGFDDFRRVKDENEKKKDLIAA